MPKDEFDFEDPLELNGVAFLTEEDTSAEMAGCFAEEFMRMGYNRKQVLAIFLNPHYTGPNMVLANKGEQFVRDIIAGTFARWGRPVAAGVLPAVEPGVSPGGKDLDNHMGCEASQQNPDGRMPPSPAGGTPAATVSALEPSVDLDDHFTDPLGNPAPKLNL
jgi:hypothetical protein